MVCQTLCVLLLLRRQLMVVREGVLRVGVEAVVMLLLSLRLLLLLLSQVHLMLLTCLLLLVVLVRRGRFDVECSLPEFDLSPVPEPHSEPRIGV